MNNTTHPAKRKQIAITYKSTPPPLLFQYLNFLLHEAQDEDANAPGIILILPINLRRSRNPEELVLTTSPTTSERPKKHKPN